MCAQVVPFLRWIPEEFTSYLLELSILPMQALEENVDPYLYRHNTLMQTVLERKQTRNVVM